MASTVDVSYLVGSGLLFSSTLAVSGATTLKPASLTFGGTATVTTTSSLTFSNSIFSVPVTIGAATAVNASNPTINVTTPATNITSSQSTWAFGVVDYNSNVVVAGGGFTVPSLPSSATFPANHVILSNVGSFGVGLAVPTVNVASGGHLALNVPSATTIDTFATNLAVVGSGVNINAFSTGVVTVTGSGVIDLPKTNKRVNVNTVQSHVATTGIDLAAWVSSQLVTFTTATTYTLPTSAVLETTVGHLIGKGDRVDVTLRNTSGGTVVVIRAPGDELDVAASTTLPSVCEMTIGRGVDGSPYILFNIPSTLPVTDLTSTATLTSPFNTITDTCSFSAISTSKVNCTDITVTGSMTIPNVTATTLLCDEKTTISTTNGVSGVVKFNADRLGWLPTSTFVGDGVAITMTVAELLNGTGIIKNTTVGASTFTLPTAAQLSSFVGGSENLFYEFVGNNVGGGATLTIIGGTGIVGEPIVVATGRSATFWLYRQSSTWKLVAIGHPTGVRHRVFSTPLTVTSNAVMGGATMSTTLTTQTASVSSNLTTTTLTTSGAVATTGATTVVGAGILVGTLSCSGAASLASTLSVTGPAGFASLAASSITGTSLTTTSGVSGTVVNTSALNVTTNLSAVNVVVKGTATVGSIVGDGGAFGGDLTLNGPTTVNGVLTITSNVTGTGTLTTSGQMIVSNPVVTSNITYTTGPNPIQINSILVDDGRVVDPTMSSTTFSRTSIYTDVHHQPRIANLVIKSPYATTALTPGFSLVVDPVVTANTSSRTYPYFNTTSGSTMTAVVGGTTHIPLNTPVISNAISQATFSTMIANWVTPSLPSYLAPFAFETQNYTTGRALTGTYHSNIIEGSVVVGSATSGAHLTINYTHSNSSTVKLMGAIGNNTKSGLFFVPTGPTSVSNLPSYTQYVVPITNSTHSLAIVNHGIPSGQNVGSVAVRATLSTVGQITTTSLSCPSSCVLSGNGYNIVASPYSHPTGVAVTGATPNGSGSATLAVGVPITNYTLTIPSDASYDTLNLTYDYVSSGTRGDFYTHITNSKVGVVNLSCVNVVGGVGPVGSFAVTGGLSVGTNILRIRAVPTSDISKFRLQSLA